MYLSEENIATNMNIRIASDEDADENEGHSYWKPEER